MTLTLESFVRRLALATENLFRRDGTVQSVFVGDIPDGRRLVFAVDESLSKLEQAAVMRLQAAEYGLVRCAAIFEGYVVTRSTAGLPAEGIERLKDELRRLDITTEPARSKVVVLYAEDARGHLQVHCDVIRVAGRPPALGRLEVQDADVIEGVFAGLLPVAGRPP